MAAKFPEDTPEIDYNTLKDLSVKDEILTCSICTESFTDPKVLPCTHTFCAGCLERYYESQTQGIDKRPDTLPCPVCRAVFPVPEKGISQLHKDAKPGALAEIARIQVRPEKRVSCDVCKYRKHDVVAQDHCTHCGINYCGVCSRDHDCHDLFKTHAMVAIRDMDKTKTLRCELHEAEMVRYYCATCMAPLCTVCAVADHKEHKTMELAEALGNKKQTVAGKINTMSEKVMKHEELLIQLEDLHNVREAAMKKTRGEIERHVASLIAQLETTRDVLLEELDKAHATGVKQIQLEKENAAFQLANMKSLWKFAAKLTEPAQALQLIAMHGDLMKMVDSMVEAPDPAMPKECLTVNMFMPRETLAAGELQKCELSTDLISGINGSASVEANGYNGYASPRAQSPVFGESYNGSSFNYTEEFTLKWQAPKLVWKIDKTGNRLGEINEAYDVTIMPNGDVVVAEWLSQRLQIFDSTGYSKDVIGQNQVQPWGVAVTREGNLATTCEKDRTVKIFSPKGFLVNSWRKNSFGWPRGVVVNRAGQYLVTDNQHGRHSVSIHLPDGQCVRQFGSQGAGNEQFHWPRYLTTDSADRIIVADSSNHCVKVFDPTGKFQFKFGSAGSRDGQLRHPRGVTCDPNGNILVADQDNNRVSLFSPRGKFVRHVLTGVTKPWGVAVTERGYLAVTQKPALCFFKVFEPMP